MKGYDLNEALKAREAARAGQRQDDDLRLDDLSRVKVLSPGRQVFKRFIRNRLAVFGSVTLIVMFVFSFLGPLFYPYGQKQIFYKYEPRNVDYAMVKENTAYTGYDLPGGASVERAVNNKMNSTIKDMLARSADSAFVNGEAQGYRVERLAEDVYRTSACQTEPVCSYGKSEKTVATYSMVGKKLDFSGEPIEGMQDAIVDAVAKSASGGTFELNGESYTYERGKAKSYTITQPFEGVTYDGDALGEDFEAALKAAVDAKASAFDFGGESYVTSKNGSMWNVSRLTGIEPAKVYTRLTVSTYETGKKVGNEMLVSALLATAGDGAFEAEGQRWTLEKGNDVWVIRDESGAEYMELTPFAVRRYNGDDTMAYGLKDALTVKALEMAETGEKTATLTYALPMQTATGEYVYDEDGSVRTQETELKLSRRETGEYVVNCQQIIFVINMFDSPSGEHILGTDGDGFDVFARIMYGGRVSLMVGFVVVFLEIFIGVIMGGLSGYYGGWVDMLIMRLVDIFYCLPSMPIMIILGALMDAMRMDTYVRLLIMMAALGIMGWAGVARLVRGQILTLREQEFMVATEATGIRVKDRIFHHLVPNIMPQLIVQATMGMGGVILTESTLSFLGLGVKHPLATWGTIINSVSSASAMQHYAFIWIPVGLLICVTVIAFNFVGDGLRDAYDPKAKR